MPLKSKLFSKNAKLEACLESHSAHITSGMKGEHVELIQAALIRFRFLDPKSALDEAGSYGNHTAKAVLKYKQFFNIVNTSYQSAADNIVGKMTIASLDSNMCILEAVRHVPHCMPSIDSIRSFKEYASHSSAKPAFHELVASSSRAKQTNRLVASTKMFSPPLSELPQDMQDTIRRSNLAKKPGTPSMYPFVANHEGPLTDDELSKRFTGFEDAHSILVELYNRMKPFGIWGLINTIQEIYRGTGSRGMFCHPHDHAGSFAHMQRLCVGPTTKPNPLLSDITKALAVTTSPFCKDAFNVHGQRDSWREIVKSGPGLHICVTNANGRARSDEKYPASDFHIDEIQQGQFCSNGVCIPLVNGQTIGHLKTVGPWLLKQPGEFLKKHSPF